MIRRCENMIVSLTAGVLLAACSPSNGSGVSQEDSERFDAIGEEETITLTGTEPFWGGEIANETLRYTTPESPDGIEIPVRRFAGLNGLGFSGELTGQTLDLAITPGDCSDQMSDRIYPYYATLRLGDEMRNGCAYTQAQPFEGDRNP